MTKVKYRKGSERKNPFERFGNKKTRRVAALNDRVKGSVRDVAKARIKSESRRKAGLLADLARERRENELVDRRIGLAHLDESSQHELRFQKAATARARQRRRQIAEKEEEGLTHSGRPLGEDENDYLDEEERQVAELDEDFKDLAPLLAADMEKRRASSRKYIRADDYDMALRELMTEPRAQAAEPAWSREEVARRQLLALDTIPSSLVPTECPSTPQELEDILKKLQANQISLSSAYEGLRIIFTPRLAGRSAHDFGQMTVALIALTKSYRHLNSIEAATTALIKMSTDAPREVAQAFKTELLDKAGQDLTLAELSLLRVLPRILSPRALLRRGIIVLARFLAEVRNDPDRFAQACLACLAAHELEPNIYLPEVHAFFMSAQPKEPISQAHFDWLKSLGPPQEAQDKNTTTNIHQAARTIEPRIEHRLFNKRDAHLDGPAAQLKRTKRLLNRERRGAMRELRRDADFLQSLRSKQQSDALSEKRAQRQKNFNWLQEKASKGWED